MRCAEGHLDPLGMVLIGAVLLVALGACVSIWVSLRRIRPARVEDKTATTARCGAGRDE